jgi:hypothetical protein
MRFNDETTPLPTPAWLADILREAALIQMKLARFAKACEVHPDAVPAEAIRHIAKAMKIAAAHHDLVEETARWARAANAEEELWHDLEDRFTYDAPAR